jgi:hypothetical protein
MFIKRLLLKRRKKRRKNSVKKRGKNSVKADVSSVPIKISLSLRINNYVFFSYSVFNLPNTSNVRPN